MWTAFFLTRKEYFGTLMTLEQPSPPIAPCFKSVLMLVYVRHATGPTVFRGDCESNRK